MKKRKKSKEPEKRWKHYVMRRELFPLMMQHPSHEQFLQALARRNRERAIVQPSFSKTSQLGGCTWSKSGENARTSK